MTPGYFSASGGIGSAWGTPVPAHVPEAGRGAPPGQDVERWARMTAERVRTWVVGGMLAFPPWLDNYTEETEAHRRAYRQMFAEPVVHAATMANVYSVAELEVQTHPQDPEDPREQEAAEFVGHALRTVRGGVVGLVTALLTGALIDGWSLVEPVWEPVTEGKYRGKWAWRAVKAKDVRHLTPLVDGFLNVVGIRSQAGLLGLRVFDPADFLLYRNLSLFESPRGLSDYRAAYRAWWIMATAWRLRALGLERWSQPSLKGTYTDEGQHRQALEAALASYQANTWLTVPLGCTVDAIDIANRGESDFKSAIADLREEMAIACSYATLTILTSAQTNPRGDSEVQKTTTQLKQWGLAANVGAVLTEQAAPPLTRLNYPGVPPCTVTLGAVDEGALSARLRNDTGLVKDLGLKLSRKESYRYYGRQQPAGPDDELGGPPAPAPKPPPGGNGTGDGAAGGPPAPPFAETFAEDFAEGKHAPPGGIEIGGKHYPGGQFIPGAVIERASPEERAALEGAKPDPSTLESQVHIAKALRIAMTRATRGNPKDQCINAAHALKLAYPEAEVWAGKYDGEPHTVARLGGRFFDVTADQFGGPRVMVRRDLPAEYRRFEHLSWERPNEREAGPIAGKFRALLATPVRPLTRATHAEFAEFAEGGLFTEWFAEEGGGGPDTADVDEQAELIAEILYGVFGPAVADSYDHAEGAETFAAGWDALHHPRGPDGRFIPKGSAEAVGAAKEKIGALKGQPATDANVAALASHLHILTVPQLRELHRQHGLKIPGRLRAQLVEGVKAQLLAAAGKTPKKGPKEAPVAPAPAAVPAAVLPPHADPARLPTDAELAAGEGRRLGMGESLHSAGMNRISLSDGRVAYHKPLKPDDVRREVLVSQLAALAGASVPAARAASYDGNDGVLTAGVSGKTLAEAWAGLGRMRPVESLKLDPGDVARHVLTGYMLDLRDRHAGNYLVGEPGPGGRRPVTSIDHEFSLNPATGPREAANKALTSDLISQTRPTDLPPAVVKAVAAAVPGMVAHLKAAGMGKEASAVAFRGEALARLAAEPKPDTQKLLEHATTVQAGAPHRPDPTYAGKRTAIRAAGSRDKEELVANLTDEQATRLLDDLNTGPDDPHARRALYEFFPELKKQGSVPFAD